MRTRMYGGVGGEEPRGFPLCRLGWQGEKEVDILMSWRTRALSGARVSFGVRVLNGAPETAACGSRKKK